MRKNVNDMAATALTTELYFITTTVIDWMDVFTRPLYKHIVVDSLKYCQKNKGLDIKDTRDEDTRDSFTNH